MFLGRAIEVREEDVPILLDGEKALTEKLHVTFEVEENYIGAHEKSVKVTSGGDLCGYPFSKGHEYLVYGRRLENGEIYVSLCSGTKWKKDATEDLKYLRGLSTAPHGSTVYGTVDRYTEPERENPQYKMIRPGSSAVGQKIKLHGSNQDYEAAVDGQGKFNFSTLPAGRYTILLESNESVFVVPPHLPTSFDLVDKGCARFLFWIDPFEKKSGMQPSPDSSPTITPPKHENRK